MMVTTRTLWAMASVVPLYSEPAPDFIAPPWIQNMIGRSLEPAAA